MSRATLALVTLAMTLVVPVMARAQTPQTNAPPGNSAIDEYLETVPGASGDRPARGTGTAGAGANALPAQQRARLERLGPDGKALADAVDATSPASPTREPQAAEGSGRSPARAALEAVAGGDGGRGMGIALPVILIGALVAAIAYVLLRRRASS